MPMITVQVSDERHSRHVEAAESMDDSGAFGWEDLEMVYEPEEIEIDFEEWQEEQGY
jgi:hypothetical protein